ncbi:hypothetical protein GGI07_002121 [Coemansia sp. Benny D115]|nr:hypothetical protein GGI07_002121 [Coemansia sp. Benny D115]
MSRNSTKVAKPAPAASASLNKVSKKAKVTKATKPAGKKTSPYNNFMKKHLASYKEKHPGVSHKEAFKGVALMWKTSPENPKCAAN